jgi:hypothetical protein
VSEPPNRFDAFAARQARAFRVLDRGALAVSVVVALALAFTVGFGVGALCGVVLAFVLHAAVKRSFRRRWIRAFPELESPYVSWDLPDREPPS